MCQRQSEVRLSGRKYIPTTRQQQRTPRSALRFAVPLGGREASHLVSDTPCVLVVCSGHFRQLPSMIPCHLRGRQRLTRQWEEMIGDYVSFPVGGF